MKKSDIFIQKFIQKQILKFEEIWIKSAKRAGTIFGYKTIRNGGRIARG